jgi:hypothetical protein
VAQREQLTQEQKSWAFAELRALKKEIGGPYRIARVLPGQFTGQHISQALARRVIGRPLADAIAAMRGTTVESMGQLPRPGTPRLQDRVGYAEAEDSARRLDGAHLVPERAWKAAAATQIGSEVKVSAHSLLSLAQWYASFANPAEVIVAEEPGSVADGV